MPGRVRYCVFTFLFNLQPLVEICGHMFPLLSASHFFLCSLIAINYPLSLEEESNHQETKKLLIIKEMQIKLRCNFFASRIGKNEETVIPFSEGMDELLPCRQSRQGQWRWQTGKPGPESWGKFLACSPCWTAL